MKNIDKGTNLNIKCFKHNGSFQRTCDQAVFLDETEDYIVCGNYKTKITERGGNSYYTKEPAILVFYKNNWFNIIAQMKEYGLFYYCNIASPFIIDDNTIKYIDYDLDLRVFPNGTCKVLDRNEYNYHKKIMNYPKEICDIVEKELKVLIQKKELDEGIFKKEVVEKYIEEFKKLVK